MSLLYYEHLILKWKISPSKDLNVCALIGGEVHFRNIYNNIIYIICYITTNHIFGI
jgi:hypothetical protein